MMPTSTSPTVPLTISSPKSTVRSPHLGAMPSRLPTHEPYTSWNRVASSTSR